MYHDLWEPDPNIVQRIIEMLSSTSITAQKLTKGTVRILFVT